MKRISIGKGIRSIDIDRVPDSKKEPWYDHVVEITDTQDEALLNSLIERVNNDDEEAVSELYQLLNKYRHDAAISFLLLVDKTGEAHKLIGDDLEAKGDERVARNHYKYSAHCGYKCGKCKYGQYYAEGKGGAKNRARAKELLKEAFKECQKVKKYLDKYGLR